MVRALSATGWIRRGLWAVLASSVLLPHFARALPLPSNISNELARPGQDSSRSRPDHSHASLTTDPDFTNRSSNNNDSSSNSKDDSSGSDRSGIGNGGDSSSGFGSGNSNDNGSGNGGGSSGNNGNSDRNSKGSGNNSSGGESSGGGQGSSESTSSSATTTSPSPSATAGNGGDSQAHSASSSATSISPSPSTTAASGGRSVLNSTSDNPFSSPSTPCPPQSLLFCFDNTDARIMYSEGWTVQTDPSGRTLHASNVTGATLFLNFTGGGIVVFGFTGSNGTNAIASYSVNSGRPLVPPVPSSDTSTLLPLFSLYAPPPPRTSQKQAQLPTNNLTIIVGNVSQSDIPSNFVLSHVMALPPPPAPNGSGGFNPFGSRTRTTFDSAAIVGGVLGSVIFFLVVGILLLYLRRRAPGHSMSTLWRRRFPAPSFEPRSDFTSLTPSTFILAHRGVTDTEPSVLEKRWTTRSKAPMARAASWISQAMTPYGPLPDEPKPAPASAATLRSHGRTSFVKLPQASASAGTLRQSDVRRYSQASSSRHLL